MTDQRRPVVVIGSGFGGAVVASRLVEAGIAVTLIERGPWRATDAISKHFGLNPAPLPTGLKSVSHLVRQVSTPFLRGKGAVLSKNGLYDIHLDRNLSIACSSGVGGGSHVYSAMNMRPEGGYWDGHHPQLSATDFERHYDWIFARMGSELAHAHPSPNGLTSSSDVPQWMHLEGVRQPHMGFEFARGKYQNNSFFGSQDNSKVTLDSRLLLPALKRGLTVLDRTEALDIRKTAAGFQLRLRDHHSGAIRFMDAERVVLAAGTLNTLRLLFASRERGSLRGMPSLGRGIGANGDVPAWWPTNHRGKDYSTGTPCHGRFTLDGTSEQTMLTRFGFNGINNLPLPTPLKRRFRQDLMLVAMGPDKADGRAFWYRGKLRFSYNRRHNPILEEIYQAFDRIGELSGVKVRFLRNHPVTVHPLGGARLSTSLAQGVINHNGEVHDIPNLYIADASALPASPGVPPSMTIAAWAGHVSDQLINKMETAP